MTKAERMTPGARRALSEAPNAALVHTCEHGHKHCATRTGAACAEEAAELQHLECVRLCYSLILGSHETPADNTTSAAAPIKSERAQQSLF